MAHFAKIDENNIVVEVIKIPNDQEHRGQDFINNDLKLEGSWIQTSYNNNIRNVFAGKGYFYDQKRDIFIPPQPESWYQFDEKSLNWFVPENIDKNTGKQLSENEIIINKLKEYFPENIVYPPEIPTMKEK